MTCTESRYVQIEKDVCHLYTGEDHYFRDGSQASGLSTM